MTLTVILNDGHGYCMLVAVASAFVMAYGGFKVGGARKKYGVKYPTMYLHQDEKNAKEFNCVQRAHQNCLENYPQFLLLLALGSFTRPHVAAVLGGVRLLGFIFYIRGYSTGAPEKRLQGAIGYIGLIGLIGLSIENAISLITA